MEFDFDLFLDDFVNTIMYDIENTEGEKEFYRKNNIKETIESKLKEFEDAIVSSYKKDELDIAYDNGYEDGWNGAREEIQELVRDMRRY